MLIGMDLYTVKAGERIANINLGSKVSKEFLLKIKFITEEKLDEIIKKSAANFNYVFYIGAAEENNNLYIYCCKNGSCYECKDDDTLVYRTAKDEELGLPWKPVLGSDTFCRGIAHYGDYFICDTVTKTIKIRNIMIYDRDIFKINEIIQIYTDLKVKTIREKEKIKLVELEENALNAWEITM